MTTIAQLNSTGRGKIIYLLEILGIGVWTTYDYTPTDSWFTTHAYGAGRVYPWLEYTGLGPIVDRIDFIEASLKVEPITAEIVDVSGAMTALVKGWRARSATYLSTTASSATATIAVEDTGSFDAEGVIYIGQEAIYHTGKNATQFTTCTRGYLGTVAAEHYVDLTGAYPEGPVATDGPDGLEGRRAILHAAVMDENGDIGATSIVYRGRIGEEMRAGRGKWTIQIRHISEVLQQNFGDGMGEAKIRPRSYYYCGDEARTSLHRTPVTVFDTTPLADVRKTVDVAEGYYSDSGLAAAFNTDSSTELLGNVIPYLFFSPDDELWHLMAAAVANKYATIDVAVGSPLWCLGFNAGSYKTDVNTAYDRTADNEPIPLLVDCNDLSWGGNTPKIWMESVSGLIDDLFVQAPGNFYIAVESLNTTTPYVELDTGRYDNIAAESLRRWHVVVDDVDDLTLRHVFAFGNRDESPIDIEEALKRMLYQAASQSEPERWCALGCLPSGHEHGSDFDWTELTNILKPIPRPLKIWNDCITGSTVVWKAIGPAFAALGITPRITTAGKIGFSRLSTPIKTLANSVDFDSSVWSLDDAKEVMGRLDAVPKINVVQVDYGFDYTRDEKNWKQPIKVIWREGISTLGRTRSASYQVRGWKVGPFRGLAPNAEALAEILDQQVRTVHFGVMGRRSDVVDIPCTWVSRQYACGDFVRVTHELAPDTIEGAVGVSDRIGVVVGRRLTTTTGESDIISVRFGADVNAYGIAPCAHGDSWVQGTLTLSFSNADGPLYAASGGNDLTAFETLFNAGEADVLLQEKDNTTADTWTATIDSISVAGKTVVLTADVFTVSGNPYPTAGVYMTIPDYDSAGALAQDYCYTSDTTPTLGSAGDPPHEWTL